MGGLVWNNIHEKFMASLHPFELKPYTGQESIIPKNTTKMAVTLYKLPNREESAQLTPTRIICEFQQPLRG